jgi:hypothetical protein
MTKYQMPPIYPAGGPLYWANDLSGILPDAVQTFFQRPAALTTEQMELLTMYLIYWLEAPCWHYPPGTREQLLAQAKAVTTRADFDTVLNACLALGIDPF